MNLYIHVSISALFLPISSVFSFSINIVWMQSILVNGVLIMKRNPCWKLPDFPPNRYQFQFSIISTVNVFVSGRMGMWTNTWHHTQKHPKYLEQLHCGNGSVSLKKMELYHIRESNWWDTIFQTVSSFYTLRWYYSCGSPSFQHCNSV